MATRTSYPISFDAYLRYAIQTGFAYFGGDRSNPTLILLVRFKKDVSQVEFLKKMELLVERGDIAGGAIEAESHRRWKSRFMTVRGPRALVAPATWVVWEEFTAYVECSIPIQPTALKPTVIDKERPKSRAGTVIAIIDDGCAFAHAGLRFGLSNTNSRVFAIWNQNLLAPAPHPAIAAGRKFGKKLVDFAYGLEYTRTPLDPGVEIGIDEWIALHKTPTDGIDEEACYREAGFDSLERRVSHGAHVMDVFAGPIPPKSRLSYDPAQPPSFARANDLASQSTTDIIFVQIPRAAVDDASGRWLSAQVSDALEFIMSCVNPGITPGTTQHVVVNLSYGPTTEPHDGFSNLEIRMCEFTAQFDGTVRKPELNIVLPAGNSRLSDGHLVFKSKRPNDTKTWTWRIPPGNPVPVFAELWVPRACSSKLIGKLLAPASAQPYEGQLPIITVLEGTADSYCWLITLPPTQAAPLALPLGASPSHADGIWQFAEEPAGTVPPAPTTPSNLVPGPHGDWSIEVTLKDPNVELHAYVARSDPNMGARVAAKQSRFIDTEWELARGGYASQTLVNGVRDITGSCIHREGTLNGIATASDVRILVAGGYRLNDDRCSPYSSVGPTRGTRLRPDYALPTDEAPALRGIRAGGTRSGATFRLVGTSTASPQLARKLANIDALNSTKPDIGCGKPLDP